MRAIWNRSAALAAFMLLLLISTAGVALAQEAGPAGHWEGAIDVPGTKLGIDVDLSQEGGAWKGDISIPLQNAKDLPLINVKVEGTAVGFEIQGIPGAPTFAGTLSADGAKIAGDFTQGGGKFPFELRRAAAPAEAAKKTLDGYEPFVEKMLQDWRVPGLAIAIVKGGQVIYQKGFGWRDREQKQPVTPDTLFAIGSSSKAFTTFTLGTLVDEGKLDWDKPVRTFLPGFQMYDAKTTEMITPRDLVTHRSGLPRHDLLWYNNKVFSRKDMVDRLRYLEPNEQLRAKWQYNNLMFLTAGYLAESLTGKSWEDNVRERIFVPLGMSHSNFSVADSQRTGDYALPYREDPETEKVDAIPFRDITNIGPAGSINSSVADMAKWVTLHLSGGKIGDRQLIRTATLEDLHAPHMVMGVQPEHKELSAPSYAMGWFVDSYRGHLRVEHGGNIDGFTALVLLMPNDDLGMVILSNLDGTGVPERLALHTLDRLLGMEPIDWNAEALGKRAAARQMAKEARAKKTSVRKPGTKPAHKLAEYAGDYENPGYGLLRMAVAGDHLEMTYNGITAPLEHWHYEVWNGKKGTQDPTFEDMKLQFQGDLRGNVAAVSAPFEPQVQEIVFEKKPDARLFDPAYLARYAGDYDLAGQTVTISLEGNSLKARVAGQPELKLIPALGGEFKIKEVSVITFRFEEDAKGNVTALVSNQPNGVFTLPRKKK